MLDDLKYIHQKDSQDAFGIAEKQWQQLLTEYAIPELNFSVKNIVFAGMGGSALWALISTSWPKYTVPFEIWRRYNAPQYIDANTLVVVSSYSGNTEETLSALAAAEQAGAHIVVAASGGKLAEIAAEKRYPFAQLPHLPQPRFGALAGLKSLVTILGQANLIEQDDAERTLHHASEFLQAQVKQWRPDVTTKDNPAKRLALEIAGTTPIIYAGSMLFPAAYKWKISFNENAKNTAFCNEIPEFSHNEFLGWTSHPVDKPYTIIDLRSSLEHPRNQKRMEVTEQMLSGMRPHPHVVQAQGETVLVHILYCIAFGDFVSLYTSLLNGLDPSPVNLIEKVKQSLHAEINKTRLI